MGSSGCTWACWGTDRNLSWWRCSGQGRSLSKSWPVSFLATKLQCVELGLATRWLKPSCPKEWMLERRDLQLEGWVTSALLVFTSKSGRQGQQLPFPPAVVCVCTGRAQAMTSCSWTGIQANVRPQGRIGRITGQRTCNIIVWYLCRIRCSVWQPTEV